MSAICQEQEHIRAVKMAYGLGGDAARRLMQSKIFQLNLIADAEAMRKAAKILLEEKAAKAKVSN